MSDAQMVGLVVGIYLTGLFGWVIGCGLLHEPDAAPMGLLWPVMLPVVLMARLSKAISERTR